MQSKLQKYEIAPCNINGIHKADVIPATKETSEQYDYLILKKIKCAVVLKKQLRNHAVGSDGRGMQIPDFYCDLLINYGGVPEFDDIYNHLALNTFNMFKFLEECKKTPREYFITYPCRCPRALEKMLEPDFLNIHVHDLYLMLKYWEKKECRSVTSNTGVTRTLPLLPLRTPNGSSKEKALFRPRKALFDDIYREHMRTTNHVHLSMQILMVVRTVMFTYSRHELLGRLKLIFPSRKDSWFETIMHKCPCTEVKERLDAQVRQGLITNEQALREWKCPTSGMHTNEWKNADWIFYLLHLFMCYENSFEGTESTNITVLPSETTIPFKYSGDEFLAALITLIKEVKIPI